MPSNVHFFALTNSDVRSHCSSAILSFLTGSSSIPKISPSTWTVTSVLKVDGFLLYYLELALLLCFPCQILLKDFHCHSQSHWQFCQVCKYFIADPFAIYMYILLASISLHCNIFVKLSVFYIYTLQTGRKVSFTYL